MSTWSSRGREGIRWISFRASCNTRHEKISQQKWTLPEGCDVTRAFLCIVRLWTLENLNLASDNVITLLMTLSLLASSLLKKLLVLHFCHQKWCCKKDALKLVQCVCESKQFWRFGVQNIHRSFVGWPGIELSIPTTFVLPPAAHRPLRPRTAGSPQRPDGFPGKPPEATRRCTSRRGTARSRPQSFWFRKAPRWTPRTTSMAGASTREAGARHRVSPTWGASKKCWEQMITSSMSTNDHDAICHIDINFVYTL